MNLAESIATNHAKNILDGVTYTVGGCEMCGTQTTLNSWDDANYCATCRVQALKEDEHYSRLTCEVVFSEFGNRFRETSSTAYRAVMPTFWVVLNRLLAEGVTQ